MKPNNLYVGIDLGTTNSVLATINFKLNGDAVSKVVDIKRPCSIFATSSSETKFATDKKATLPSYVYYREENNYEPLVGNFAKDQYPLRPHLVAKSIKSQMGKPFAEGLSPDIPDKTPAQISSNILKHMLNSVSETYRCKITDAVITVPANFDSAMCKATKDAAELAGIRVKNADGSQRPILLSEPNAVIYDLINQIHNGELPNHILDLEQKKNVLVFDLGGGTLDITMHEIKRRDTNSDVLKVNEIATNRYTLLGGDDFDEEIAKVMYERYLKQYAKHPEAISDLQKAKKIIMAQLRAYAELLKLDLSEQCTNNYISESNWSFDDDEDEEITFSVGGNMGGIGYSYDDTFTKEEIETILSSFMAEELNFNDYKNLDKITNTRNIIYPILDVLKKAYDKMNMENVIVDAVIVNGGMSKFYMVTDRLKKFFGLEPIVALDPDQSVARGAAVYHYYLHKYEELQDDMKQFDETDTTANQTTSNVSVSNSLKQVEKEVKTNIPTIPKLAIEWGNSILNDSLYLGAKNGAVSMIIPTGAELPYTSKVMTGFQIEAGQNKIVIPIKSKNLDGTYRTISSGNITFKNNYPNGAFVAFIIQMERNKVITMNAWTSTDANGLNKMEEGFVEIAIDNCEHSNIKSKFVAPRGSVLEPKAEINNMLQLFQSQASCKNKQVKNTISKRISSNISSICNAGNKEDFAEPILNTLRTVQNEDARQRLFTIARKLGPAWNETQKSKLAKICMTQLHAELNGLSMGGPRVSTNNQAIYTLGICATKEELKMLSSLHNKNKYYQACLYTHAKTKTDIKWLLQQFEKDLKQAKRKLANNLQFSSYAIGVALRNDDVQIVDTKTKENVVKNLIEVINTGNLTTDELNSSMLAIGWICDQRQNNDINAKLIKDALDIIRNVYYYYPFLIIKNCTRMQELVDKMLSGTCLNEDEEQFLLTKLEF